MLKRFLPPQHAFFELFQKIVDTLVLTSTEFKSLLLDLDNHQEHVDKISDLEIAGDILAHTTFESLHKTFITPFDRHDIHELTSKLDDILDLINRCAQRFPIYNLKERLPDEMIELATLTVDSTILLKEGIYRLHTLHLSDEIFKFCEEIDTLENKAHVILLVGEKKLYEETDFKHFVKLKEIYTRIKEVINMCQDVANIIKGIVLEYS